jgi:ABC-type dipeptide/oligopeptide/nickel transport system permease subunit
MVQQTELATESVGQPRSERVLGDAASQSRSKLRSTPGFYSRAWRRLRRDKVAMIALVICISVVLFAVCAPIVSEITGHSYETGDLRANLVAPGEQGYILGTDANGRDILTRLAYGGRISLMVAWLSALVALAVGGTVGSIAGYYGGFIDSALMRFVDVIIAIPGITLLLLLSTLWSPGPVGLALVIAALGWTGIARLVRGEVLSLKSRDYVDAARVIGATNSRIIYRHIFPNVLSLVIVWISLAIPGLIIAEASLSYLGFGVRIPIPSWGNMLDEAKEFYRSSWTYVFLPGLAIYITALGFNLLGNGLRDALDPRLND